MVINELLTDPRALIQLGVWVGIGTGIGGFIVNLVLSLIARMLGIDAPGMENPNEEQK